MAWSKAKRVSLRRRVRQADLAHSGKRENPFKPQESKSRKPLILGLIGALSALGAAGLFLFHPAFRVDVIGVAGASRTDYAELHKTARQVLDTKILWVIPGSNYFLLDKQEIEAIIQTRFKLQSVKVTKTFPHTIKIEIIERGPQLITVQGGVVTALDPDGAEVAKLGRLQTTLSSDLKALISEARLIQRSSPDLYKPLPLVVLTTVNNPLLAPGMASSTPSSTESIIVSSSTMGVTTTDVAADTDLITGVLAWNSFLNDSNKRADYFVINSWSEGETVLSESGTKLLINFTENRDRQFLAASTFWKQNKTSSTIQYLDLRYPGKIFWK